MIISLFIRYYFLGSTISLNYRGIFSEKQNSVADEVFLLADGLPDIHRTTFYNQGYIFVLQTLIKKIINEIRFVYNYFRYEFKLLQLLVQADKNILHVSA